MSISRSRYKCAVALSYDKKGDSAPSVSAKGTELAADEVVRIARRYGVPVVEKPELARTLNALEADESIPQNLFEAVAVVLCRIDKGLRRLF